MSDEAEIKKTDKNKIREGETEICPYCREEIEIVSPGWGRRRRECGCTRKFRMYFDD